MYGFLPKGSKIGVSDLILEFDSAGTFAANDLVMPDGSTGEIVVGTATSELIGVALEAATSASTGVAVNATPFLVGIMDNDNVSVTFSKSYTLMWGDLTGGTGAMLLDTDTLATTSAQLYALTYNPQGYGYDSDTSIGLVMINEHVLWMGKEA